VNIANATATRVLRKTRARTPELPQLAVLAAAAVVAGKMGDSGLDGCRLSAPPEKDQSAEHSIVVKGARPGLRFGVLPVLRRPLCDLW
jgi:hypothetical protein